MTWTHQDWNSEGFPFAVKRKDGGMIASLWQNGTIDDTEANARLVAAAPDLLAACKTFLGALEDCRIRLGYPTSALADASIQVRAAIAKATPASRVC